MKEILDSLSNGILTFSVGTPQSKVVRWVKTKNKCFREAGARAKIVEYLSINFKERFPRDERFSKKSGFTQWLVNLGKLEVERVIRSRGGVKALQYLSESSGIKFNPSQYKKYKDLWAIDNGEDIDLRNKERLAEDLLKVFKFNKKLKWYLFGFFLGDGSYRDKSYVELLNTDPDFYLSLCNLLGVNLPFVMEPTFSLVRVEVRSKLVSRALRKFKSKKYLMPKFEISEESLPWVLLGLLDADGTYYWDKSNKIGRAYINIACHPNLADSILRVLPVECKVLQGKLMKNGMYMKIISFASVKRMKLFLAYLPELNMSLSKRSNLKRIREEWSKL